MANQEYYQEDYSDFSLDSTRAFNDLSYWSSLFGRMIMDNMPLKSGAKVLDVACGLGFPLFEMAERLGPTAELIGIDIWETALQVAEEKISARKITNAKVQFADAAHMPFEDESFHLITSNLGINNFADPAYVLKEIRRVLKKEGSFLLTSNLIGHMQEFYSLFEGVLENEELDDCLPLLQEHIEHRGSKESLLQLLDESEFKIKSIKEDTFTYRYLDGAAFFNSYFIKACFMPAWKEIIPQENHASVFKKIEFAFNYLVARSREIKLTIPAIYIEAI
jgi:arsenite methyltransferase